MSKRGPTGAGSRDASAEEQRYGIEQEIESVEALLIEREAELVDLRVELSAFRLEYDTRVGRQVEELEQVETELRRCQERVADYRLWGAKGAPGTRAGTPYVSVEEQFRRTWKEPEEAPAESPSWEDASRPLRPSAGTHIKALYRQLCRRFHPDLTQDPAERARRTQTMAAVNAAYAARDLADSPAAQMSLDVKLARRQGRDLLAEMAAQTAKELTRKRAELDFMLAQLRQLGITA
jgi:hypothetical protein